MRVLVVNNMAPFIWGGAEELADQLVRRLRRANVEADLCRIPFVWEPAERLIEEMLRCRTMRLSGVDRVIALKFPAYLAPFDDKVLWLLHQYRQAYDLWDAGLSNIPDDAGGRRIRAAIRAADDACFAACLRIFANHATTADRLRRHNGVEAEILMPPLNDPELFTGGEAERFVFAAGRVNDAKRQHLLVAAMAHMREEVKLVVAGPPDSAADAARLRRLVAECGLEDRVHLRLGRHDRADVAGLVNRALAVAYAPFEEDSVGYVTMEAFEAAKPVLTCDDSGGVLDLVRDGETGRVAPPEPRALADAMDALAAAPEAAARMGRNAREAWRARGISWDATIERLLS